MRFSTPFYVSGAVFRVRPLARRSSLFALVSAGAIASLGCTVGQIGGEVDHDDTEGQPSHEYGCVVAEETPIAAESPEEETLGIMLAMIEGTHEADLKWGGDTSGFNVTVTPPASTSSITIMIEPLVETAVVADLEVPEPKGGGQAAIDIERPDCADEVRVDARVTVSTENGAFHDTFEATFSTKNGLVASASVAFAPGDLDGTFDAVPADSRTKVSRVRLDLAFVLGTMSGKFVGEVTSADNEQDGAATGGGLVFGRFPVDSCESGYLLGADSQLAAEISETLADKEIFELTWEGGEATEFQIESEVGKLCYQSYAGDSTPTVTAEVSAQVSSTDGRLSATWPLYGDVEVSAEGAFVGIYLRNDWYDSGPVSPEEFAESSGISGIVTTETELGFSFHANVPAGEEQATGALEILKFIVPECAEDGYEPDVSEDGDGASTPDCSGIDATPIETALLSGVSATE